MLAVIDVRGEPISMSSSLNNIFFFVHSFIDERTN